MKRWFAALATAASFTLATPVWADEISAYDRFQLWNDCGTMDLVVEWLNEDAAAIGLTREAIEIATRSRLRGARLYDAEQFTNVYVQITVVSAAFNIKVEYQKPALDVASGEIYVAATWEHGVVGTHGQDSNYILSTLSQSVDRFIDEYLRVNADAC